VRTFLAVTSLTSILLVGTEVRAEPPELKATYDRGVVVATEDGDFQLRLALRNQIRFEVARTIDDGAESEARFSIPRSRLQVEGWVFGEDTRYKLELALGDRGSFSFVRDLWVEQALGTTPVRVRVGQWKRPFNRQELVADFSSELNERAITAELAGGGRDLGLAVHNDYEASPDGLEWALGVFNSFSGGADRPAIATTCAEEMTGIECGTPPPSTVPRDFAPAVVARAGWNHGGIKGYSEGDLEGGPLRVAVGASYKIDLADLGDAAALSHGAEVDALLKVHGFDLQLGVYLMKLAAADAQLGAFGQAGQFVLPERAQVAARLAVAPSTVPGSDRQQLEARAAFNWFWEGHRWKLATDVGVLRLTGRDGSGARDAADLQIRSMAQLTF
jgi:hypothetical protein